MHRYHINFCRKHINYGEMSSFKRRSPEHNNGSHRVLSFLDIYSRWWSQTSFNTFFVSWVRISMVSARCQSPWQPSRVSVAATPTSSSRRLMSTWPSALESAPRRRWVTTKSRQIAVIPLMLAFFPPTGRENRHNHPEPTSVQDPQLVLEQTKGHHRWQVHTAHLIQLGLKAPWRFGTIEEDPRPQGYAPLLGSPCPWSTHENNRPSWSHCWCVQEEVKCVLCRAQCRVGGFINFNKIKRKSENGVVSVRKCRLDKFRGRGCDIVPLKCPKMGHGLWF